MIPDDEARLEKYYAKQPDAIRECLLALRQIILAVDKHITAQRKFQIPFFYYKDKKLCYLWVNRKKLLLGFATDKSVLPDNGTAKKRDAYQSIQIDPEKDIPMRMIRKNLKERIALYRNTK